MSHRLRKWVGAASILGLVGAVPIGTASSVSSPDATVFISEFHYDNDGTDQGEAIEVFGPAGTDLTGWTLDLYNGNNNLRYDTDPLPASIPDIDGTGYGVVVVNYPTNGIQNGGPDGMALVDDVGMVRQFLSYEGTMTATDGPAAGLESTDIGVAESSTTPIGESLQLVGEGVCYGALAWAASDTNTFGALGGLTPDASAPCEDSGGDPPPPVRINEMHYDNDGTDENEAVEVAGPAGTDLTGWSLVRYNGSNGSVYGTDALSGTLDDLGDATGVTVVTYATNGLQNGAPDGVALVAPDATVVEFVSYEGVFTATGGPAAGMDSVDIGVEETGDTATDQSLQRDAAGSWFGPVCASFGRANDPDAPVDCPEAAPVVLNASLISTAGSNDPEYIELFGTPGLSLGGYSVIGVESDDQSSNGSIDHRYDLGADDAIGDNGFFLLGNATVASELGVTPDFEIPINALENSSITLALVETASITGNTAGDVGVVLDAVGVTDGGASDAFAFGAPVVGPDGPFLPAGVRRIVDGVDTDTPADWELLVFSPRDDPANVPTAGGGDGNGDPVTEAFIHEVQGSGGSVAISGDVRVEAIVTSLFQRDDVLDGFFIQEEDADADAESATSEGIFVYCRGNCPLDLATGDLVDVTGTATEFFGMSQIDIAFGNGTANVVSSDNPLPAPTPVSLPANGSTSAEATFESTEGMVVTFPGQLVVSEYFELARFGQVVLTDGARPYQFTDDNAPSVDGYAAFLEDLESRRIILDDDNNDQNDAISDGPDEPYPYPTPGLSTSNRFRGGDTIEDLTGVMHWSFAGQSGTDAWRIRPIDEIEYTFESANPAPDSPDDVGGRITAASFNVLNLFSTIDTTSSSNSGPCGPSDTLDCRGADSEAELARQQAKIAAAIAEIDAAVVGLIELENDGDDESVRDLVGVVNSVPGAGIYDFVPTGFIGEDAIKVGLIYQPALVTPVGDFAVLDESVDERFLDSKNRPMLVQTFEENLTGARFTVAVNHLKSKGSSCGDVGDPDLNDGQASCPGTRADAASAIADYLASDPTGSGDGDVLILGDLNSYAMETPITILEDAGYTDLLDAFVGPDAYTYVFDGQLGYLDYALANAQLVDQITGATAWHINADEVPLFDYNDDVRDAGEASFERESGVLPLYEPDPLRSSDHDPVIVGIDLDIDVATVIGLTIERVDALEADGVLNRGQAAALRRRLDQALRQYESGRIDSTVGILTGVVDQIDDFVADGVLSPDEAAPLSAAIMIVLDTIG